MKPFKILNRAKIVDEKFCKIEKQQVTLPNETQTDWYLNMSPDAGIIIPMDDQGRVLLQRSYKHGSGQILIEFPAGMIEPGESEIDGIARELLEETGYAASDIIKIGQCYANPTSSPMVYHFYIGQNCTKVAEPTPEPTEQIENFWVSGIGEARDILTDPTTITSAGAIAALGFWRERL